LCVVCAEKRRWLTLCLVQSLACVEEAEGRLAAPKAADEALVQRHTELVKEAEALRASLTEREERIKRPKPLLRCWKRRKTSRLPFGRMKDC
jgi:hypothetical protein